MNYVALALVVADGHTLLHHPHTQSEVDIKKNVFTMMMRLPRLYRIPVHTVHKFGHLVTGMSVRFVDVVRITRKVGVANLYGSWRNATPHLLGSAGVRVLLVAELVAFTLAGDFWAWALQFVLTLWISTLLIVSSHDFEEDAAEDEPDTDDWGVHQVDTAYDLKVVGIRHVDCFLSAGLSSHRVHHVVPYQRSGFANIATEDVLREEAARFGVEWLPAKSFLTDRLPKLSQNVSVVPVAAGRGTGLGFPSRAPVAGSLQGQRVVRGGWIRRAGFGMSAGQRLTRSVDAFGSPEIGLEQLPPSPPTTVAVIEGIATGAPQRVVSQAAAANHVAELFDLGSEQRVRVARVFEKTRVDTRRMAVDPTDPGFDAFRRRPGLSENE